MCYFHLHHKPQYINNRHKILGLSLRKNDIRDVGSPADFVWYLVHLVLLILLILLVPGVTGVPGVSLVPLVVP